MDGLIQQIAQTIEPPEKSGQKETQLKALKEIVLSGLSRSGFFRDYPFLPGIDHYENDCLFISFLKQDDKELYKPEDCFHTAAIELAAAGVVFTEEDIPDGFRIKAGELFLEGIIIRKNYDLQAEISYQQVPIPYEIRNVKKMREGTRTEILNLFEKRVKADMPEEKKKKGGSKPPKKNKNRSASDDQVMQLSLFDF